MIRTLCLLALGIPAVAWAATTAAPALAADETDNRLFELRTYTTNDGKLPELHNRFRDHTNQLFEKHGMTLVGFWTPTEGPGAGSTLVYILAYPNREAREQSWKAFLADPDWQAAFKASTANGRLVKKVESQFLAPTDYSPLK
jgi:hypothetical protein